MTIYRPMQRLVAAFAAMILVQSPFLLKANAAPSINKPAPACRIDIGDVHPSTYFAERHRLHTIKVNVDSLCDKSLSQVHIHVLIYKTGFPVDHLVKRYDNPEIPYIAANKKYFLKDVVAVCRNWKKTNFYAEAYGDAREGGVLVGTPKWKSKKIVPLECGT